MLRKNSAVLNNLRKKNRRRALFSPLPLPVFKFSWCHCPAVWLIGYLPRLYISMKYLYSFVLKAAQPNGSYFQSFGGDGGSENMYILKRFKFGDFVSPFVPKVVILWQPYYVWGKMRVWVTFHSFFWGRLALEYRRLGLHSIRLKKTSTKWKRLSLAPNICLSDKRGTSLLHLTLLNHLFFFL